MIEITFIHPDGRTEGLQGKPGDTVMDVALDNGVAGIIAQCGGGCTCCTCHCWIEAPWYSQLPQAHQDEVDMLAYAWGLAANSRLACQVELTPALSGMRVQVPKEQS